MINKYYGKVICSEDNPMVLLREVVEKIMTSKIVLGEDEEGNPMYLSDREKIDLIKWIEE